MSAEEVQRKLGKMGGSNRAKRSTAPPFWPIPRKVKEFTIKTSPGPHGKDRSYALGVLIRDVLHLVNTYREARFVANSGKVRVDGVVRRDLDFPVGLMDVIEFDGLGKVYRLVPRDGKPLEPIEIPVEEKSLKLCKIINKVTVRGGVIQYTLHDGRCILDREDLALRIGDACLIEVPSQKIINTVSMKKGVRVLVIGGERAGLQGYIEELKPGTFTRKPMATLNIGTESVELPTSLLMPVGGDRPLIYVGG